MREATRDDENKNRSVEQILYDSIKSIVAYTKFELARHLIGPVSFLMEEAQGHDAYNNDKDYDGADPNETLCLQFFA